MSIVLLLPLSRCLRITIAILIRLFRQRPKLALHRDGLIVAQAAVGCKRAIAIRGAHAARRSHLIVSSAAKSENVGFNFRKIHSGTPSRLGGFPEKLKLIILLAVWIASCPLRPFVSDE
jgi:hypothetical protein